MVNASKGEILSAIANGSDRRAWDFPLRRPHDLRDIRIESGAPVVPHPSAPPYAAYGVFLAAKLAPAILGDSIKTFPLELLGDHEPLVLKLLKCRVNRSRTRPIHAA